MLALRCREVFAGESLSTPRGRSCMKGRNKFGRRRASGTRTTTSPTPWRTTRAAQLLRPGMAMPTLSMIFLMIQARPQGPGALEEHFQTGGISYRSFGCHSAGSMGRPNWGRFHRAGDVDGNGVTGGTPSVRVNLRSDRVEPRNTERTTTASIPTTLGTGWNK